MLFSKTSVIGRARRCKSRFGQDLGSTRVKNNSFCQILCQPTKIDPKVEIPPAGLALRRRKSTSPGRAQAKTREWPTRMANRETEDQQKLRFQVELEFVQCLANPNYLNFLAQRGYFKDPAFVNYLKYLQYWKEPEYARYLKYPMCLYFLELLQHDHFRKEIVNAQCTKFIDEQQLLHWQHYTRKRMRLLQAQPDHSLPNIQTIKREN